jgi:hypothetical protein
MTVDKLAEPVSQTAFKFALEVQSEGLVEFRVPLLVGTLLEVFVVQAEDDFGDLLLASQSSLDVWDNPIDDEDWNDRPSQPGNS